MDAPKCPHCGKRHWSRQPCAAAAAKKQRSDSVTKNAPAVTINPLTDNPVTPKRGRGRPKTGKAMSTAEKMRRYRARRKAAGERAKG